MPEKYGVYAQLVPSVASTPVDTSTNIVFIGAAQIENVEGWANMDLINRPIYISSLSDYEKKLGGGLASAGFNLTEAAEAAFSVVGISGAYFINVHDPNVEDEDLSADAPFLGSAAAKTGIYAVLALPIASAPCFSTVTCVLRVAVPPLCSILFYYTHHTTLFQNAIP